MRILASSDLHYNIDRSKEPARDLARRVASRGGDVLVLAGDIAGIEPELFLQGLELFSGFRGTKLLVAGNHDLWVRNGDCSYDKWTRRLPDLAKQAGFEMLDHGPKIVGNTGFVGNIGWYDYSFQDERLKVPERFYRAKVGPGRALRMTEWNHLLDGDDPVLPVHLSITTSWRDGEFVKLGMSDGEFVNHLADKLRGDLARTAGQCRRIVAVMHHLPCRQLVWYRDDANWDFATAFLGSQQFGDILRDFPSINLCLCGHSHRAGVVKRDNLEYITIGSTYVEKVLLEFED